MYVMLQFESLYAQGEEHWELKISVEFCTASVFQTIEVYMIILSILSKKITVRMTDTI